MLHFLSTLCPLVTGEAVQREVRTAAIIFGLKKNLLKSTAGICSWCERYKHSGGVVMQLEEWKEDDIVSIWLSLLIIMYLLLYPLLPHPQMQYTEYFPIIHSCKHYFPSSERKNMPCPKTTQFYTVIFNPYYITTLRTQEKF